MKKFAAVLLVLILIVSISASAFAVTYPTVTRRSALTQSVRRGNTAYFKFYLRSGSYTRKSGYYRARFDLNIYRNANNRKYATGMWGFTGNFNFTTNWNVPSSTPRGKYNVIYRTCYRNSIYSSSWYYRNQYICYLNVR